MADDDKKMAAGRVTGVISMGLSKMASNSQSIILSKYKPTCPSIIVGQVTSQVRHHSGSPSAVGEQLLKSVATEFTKFVFAELKDSLRIYKAASLVCTVVSFS